MARNFNPIPQVDRLPIASGIPSPTARGYNIFKDANNTALTTSATANDATFGTHQTASTAAATLQTVISYSGQGYIDVLAFIPSETDGGQVVLTVDGVVLKDITVGAVNQFFGLIGSFCPGGSGGAAWAGGTVLNTHAGTPIPFNSSILIQHRVTGGAAFIYTYYHVVKTA